MGGIKIMGGGNEKVLKFLRSAIQYIDELWTGVNVEAVNANQIPYKVRVKMWVPPPVIEDKAILIRGRARDNEEGKYVWLKVNA